MVTELSTFCLISIAHTVWDVHFRSTMSTNPILIAAEPNYESACLFWVQKDYLPNLLLPVPRHREPLTWDQIIACAYWQSSVLEQISTPLINSCLCEHTDMERDSHCCHYLWAVHINVPLWMDLSTLEEISQSTRCNLTCQALLWIHKMIYDLWVLLTFVTKANSFS